MSYVIERKYKEGLPPLIWNHEYEGWATDPTPITNYYFHNKASAFQALKDIEKARPELHMTVVPV